MEASNSVPVMKFFGASKQRRRQEELDRLSVRRGRITDLHEHGDAVVALSGRLESAIAKIREAHSFPWRELAIEDNGIAEAVLRGLLQTYGPTSRYLEAQRTQNEADLASASIDMNSDLSGRSVIPTSRETRQGLVVQQKTADARLQRAERELRSEPLGRPVGYRQDMGELEPRLLAAHGGSPAVERFLGCIRDSYDKQEASRGRENPDAYALALVNFFEEAAGAAKGMVDVLELEPKREVIERETTQEPSRHLEIGLD